MSVSRHRDFDVIVIGAGLGGLVCADTLASAGKRVALLEQHEAPGGYCSSFRRGGYTFDSAIDSIGGLDAHGVLAPIFRRLGLSDEIGLVPLDPVRENFFRERSIAVPADLDAYKEELARHFPGESGPIAAFLDLLAGLFREIRTRSMEETYGEGVSDALRACRDLTWAEFARGRVSEAAADALAERCCFLGAPPSRVSAVSLIMTVMNYFDGGACRVKGGFQKLADALATDFRRRGGSLRLGTAVSEIVCSEGSAVAVRTQNGEEVSAADIVSGADARATLGRHVAAEAQRLLDSTPISGSFVVIHLGVSDLPQALFRATSIGYYPGGTVEGAHREGADPIENPDAFVGFSLPSRDDATLAPPEKQIVTIHHPVPHLPADAWSAKRDRAVEAILTKVERLLPGLRGRIERRSVAAPPTLERYTRNFAGSAFGWAHTPERWNGVRRLQEALPCHLFQAGHWSDYGGGTVSAMLSGHETARKILKGWTHQRREETDAG